MKDAIHPTVDAAVRKATREAGQPDQVAERLLLWMNAVSRGESDLDKQAEVSERLDAVFGKMQTDTDE